MFKTLNATFLLGLLLLSLFYNSVVWLNYELNIEEITEKYCINKDRPELQCNGKCHIKRKLIFNVDQEDQTAPQSKPIRSLFTDNFLVKSVVKINLTDNSILMKLSAFKENKWFNVYPEPPFIPPIATV